MSTLNPESIASTVDQTIHSLAAEAKLEASKDHASQAVREIKDAALYKAREVRENAAQKATEVRRMVETSVKDARGMCEQKTREKPMSSLLCAFGAGFVLGLILRR
jgi:ElaB/YqjD/DUF883 family membrane-anchored ribosome-binding protein